MIKCYVFLNVLILTVTIPKVILYNTTSMNVGTVLFRECDRNKFCWTRESATLLNSRMIMQDLIPITLQNTQNDLYISAFINYINACLDASCKITRGLSQQLMVLALADTIGGYLRAYLLPATKQAFYAGNIRYEQAKKLFDLFDEVKAILKTNGATWRKPSPCFNSNAYKIRPLEIVPPPTSEDACADFITIEKPGGCDERGEKICPSICIPIPFLDDNRKPHSIAVPLKVLSLHSLEAATSKFLVVKYYVAGTKCLLSHSVPEQEIIKFNKDFRRWLLKAVVPHLSDEKWYPAFGGVLKIFETMKRLGAGDFSDNPINEVPSHSDSGSGQRRFQEPLLKKAFVDSQRDSVEKKDLPSSEEEYEEEEENGKCAGSIEEVIVPGSEEQEQKQSADSGEGNRDVGASFTGGDDGENRSEPSDSSKVIICILMALLAALLLWVLVGLIYLCVCLCSRMFSRKEKSVKRDTPSSGQRIIDTFVQVYYGLIGNKPSSSQDRLDESKELLENKSDVEKGSLTRCPKEGNEVCQCLVHEGYSATSDSEGESGLGNATSSR